ncbi:hypothetical protein DFH07DRAFT_698554, partial [Mycena maculata]
IAKKIAALVWGATGYHFIYKKATKSRTSDTVVTYTFYCAQNEKEVTKTRLVEDEHKRRARMKMDCFPCAGLLHVTVDSENQDTVRLWIAHHRAHCHYVDISLSSEITKVVEDMRNQPASNTGTDNYAIQIWTRILQDFPGTEATQKQIYALW